MKITPFITTVFLCFFFSLSHISAQEYNVDLGTVLRFTPHVTEIQAALDGTRVRVSWSDIQDLSIVRYRVYRAPKEIFLELLPFIEVVGEVPSGTEEVEDIIRKNGAYYYAVSAVDRSGIEIPILVSKHNKTVNAVVVDTLEEQGTFTNVSALRARVGDTGVDLTFNAPRDRRFVLYRSTEPISNIDDLDRAIKIKTLGIAVQHYTDNSYPGIPYYYALVDNTAIINGLNNLDELDKRKIIVTGQNSLTRPIQLPETVAASSRGEVVDRALPAIRLDQAITDGGKLRLSPVEIYRKRALQNETTEALNRISQNNRSSPLATRPLVLESELARSFSFAQDKALAAIIDRNFRAGDYEETTRLLEEFLVLPLPNDVLFRARFYYAQSFYFDDNADAAVSQFVLILNQNPSIVRPWVYTALEAIGRK